MTLTRSIRLAAACIVAAVLAAACGSVVSPDKNKNDVFSDTLDPGGSKVQNYSISKSGEYSITLDSLTPSVNVFLTVVFGQSNGASCIPFSANSFSTAGKQVLAGAIYPGSYCVAVIDATGTLPQSVTFSVTFSHP
jgi:hypothetical protein